MTDIAKLSSVSPTPVAKPDAAAAKTARDFEAVFLGQMTQMMMESVGDDGEFSGGHGEQMFRGVMAEKLGTAIAAGGGIGLAPAVLEQIIQLQGGAEPTEDGAAQAPVAQGSTDDR